METIERRGGVLVLDREVAAVEADLDVLEQRAPGLVRGAGRASARERRTANRQQPALEEVDRLGARLEQAVGLGLDVEVDERSVSRRARTSAAAIRATFSVITRIASAPAAGIQGL